MTREEKKRKAAAIGAAIMIGRMQNNINKQGFNEDRWMLMGLNRAMEARNVTHLHGRAFGGHKW